jgi:hypothetical protein
LTLHVLSTREGFHSSVLFDTIASCCWDPSRHKTLNWEKMKIILFDEPNMPTKRKALQSLGAVSEEALVEMLSTSKASTEKQLKIAP